MTHPLDPTQALLEANLLAAAHSLAQHNGHVCGFVSALGAQNGEGVYFGNWENVMNLTNGPGREGTPPRYSTLPPEQLAPEPEPEPSDNDSEQGDAPVES